MKKFLKWTGIILGFLIILIIALGIIMPKDFTIEKSKDFDYPPAVVYNILNDLSLQPEWNPWLIEDESMKVTFSEKTIGKGASYTYTSEKMGSGSEQITNSVINKSIDITMAFEDEDQAQSQFLIDPTEKGSKINWSFSGRMGFPTNIMLPLMKWQIGKSFKNGLKNLEKLAQSRWENKDYYGFNIQEKNLPERSYVMKRSVVGESALQQFYMTNFGSLFQAVQKSGEIMDGSPSSLCFAKDREKNTYDIAAAIPVQDPVDILGAASVTMDAGPGIVVDHYGDYSSLPIAHLAIETYMRDREMVHHIPYIEEFISDPGEESDPSKVLTKIYYYLAKSGMEK